MLKNTEMNRIIFGKVYRFLYEPSLELHLVKSLELYEHSDGSKPQVIVNLSKNRLAGTVISSNPKIYQKTANGMSTDFGILSVHWFWAEGGELQIDATLREKRKGPAVFIKRLLSMEYPDYQDFFGQVLHELILVPSCYFFNDVAPVHASCIGVNGKAAIFAGTGGVGKSSALLAFKDNPYVEFLSDDIAVVSDQECVYGNMAHPKVYGYNCEGNQVKGLLLKNRGLIDRMHFNLKLMINPATVRRKIAPALLFNSARSNGAHIKILAYLVRENREDLSVEELALSDAVEMTIAVMSAEYQVFHKFLDWELYNSIAMERNPIIVMKRVVDNWREVLSKSFFGAECLKVRIPISMENSDYQRQLKEIILSKFVE